MNLSRPQFLLVGLAALGVANLAWYWIDGWGKVTIHVRKEPLSQVAASIARQGHIALRADLDPATPVTLDFDKVPVADAVDRLAIVVDARWRLTYLVGPDKRAFAPLLDSWAAGKPDPAWRWIDRPVRGGPGGLGLAAGDDGDPAPDPRAGAVTLTSAPLPAPPPPPPQPVDAGAGASGQAPPAPPAPEPAVADAKPLTELQPLLEKAALFSDVQTAVPADWSPAVGTFSAKAEPAALFAKLARAAHGASAEVFLVSLPPRRGQRPDAADGDNPQPFRNRMNPAAMDLALQAYVDRLPPAQKAQAQAELDDRRKQWKEMQGLTPEQRRARFQEMMNNPAFQEQMDDRQLNREAKMTPEQRQSRMGRYVAAKAAARAK